MHDIGRTQLEFGETELGETEFGEMEFGETAFGELGEFGETEFGETSGPLGETAELELATELLEVTNEQELEQFLGNLVSTVSRNVGSVLQSPQARALGRVLKATAIQALPALGQAVFGDTGLTIGTALATRFAQPSGPTRTGHRRPAGQRRGPSGGQRRAPAARPRRELSGQLFGLELEGLSHEDREFEVAKQFVRFASTAAHNALAASPATGSPLATARAAAAAAAAQHAPGLVPLLQARPGGRGARSGRWVRRGHSIVLIGI
jgi:hypothetical protein